MKFTQIDEYQSTTLYKIIEWILIQKRCGRKNPKAKMFFYILKEKKEEEESKCCKRVSRVVLLDVNSLVSGVRERKTSAARKSLSKSYGGTHEKRVDRGRL